MRRLCEKRINVEVFCISTLALIIIVVTCAMLLTGCNKQVFDFDYAFNEAYIIDTGETIKIKSWCDYDNSDMIQFTDTDGKVYMTHSSNVILMK